MKKVLIVGAAVAAVVVAGTATPASADVHVVDGTHWSIIEDVDFGIDQFSVDQNTAPHGAYTGDGFALLLEEPTNLNNYLGFDCSGATSTVEADGDLRLDCDNPVALLNGDLTWDAHITIFAGDYRGIVGRTVFTLTNTTGSDVTNNIRYEVDTEECDQGDGNIATSSGDLDTGTNDAWLLCNNENRAIEGFAWGNNWLNAFYSDDTLTACDVCVFESNGFVIEANSTVTLVFFVYSEGSTDHGANFGDTDENIIANATSYFDTTTLGATRLWEGLTTATNWDGVVGSYTATDPTLPDTGVDVIGLLMAALAFAGLGAVIVVRRRAAKASRADIGA